MTLPSQLPMAMEPVTGLKCSFVRKANVSDLNPETIAYFPMYSNHVSLRTKKYVI